MQLVSLDVLTDLHKTIKQFKQLVVIEASVNALHRIPDGCTSRHPIVAVLVNYAARGRYTRISLLGYFNILVLFPHIFTSVVTT